eukprot:1253014-Amphidinium_carterae.2
MEEPGVPAPGGLGEPALEAAEEEAAEQQEAEVPPPGGPPDEGAVPADEPPPAEGAQEEPLLSVAPPAADPPLALPTDHLEFQDAEEGDRLEESPPLHSETRHPRQIKENGSVSSSRHAAGG